MRKSHVLFLGIVPMCWETKNYMRAFFSVLNKDKIGYELYLTAIKERDEQFFSVMQIKEDPGTVGGSSGSVVAVSDVEMSGQAAQEEPFEQLESVAS